MPRDDKQLERFVEVARMLGADESEERFDAALRKVAAHKPEKKQGAEKSKTKR
jgi:hypothetical protein